MPRKQVCPRQGTLGRTSRCCGERQCLSVARIFTVDQDLEIEMFQVWEGNTNVQIRVAVGGSGPCRKLGIAHPLRPPVRVQEAFAGWGGPANCHPVMP